MLVITLGDPFSINVELVQGALSTLIPHRSSPLVLIGSRWHWDQQCRQLGGSEPRLIAAKSLAEIPPRSTSSFYIDVGDGSGGEVSANQLSVVQRGTIATRALAALRGFQPKERFAVVTCPIDKFACREAGFGFPGHTEFFASLWKAEAIMVLAGARLRVGLVTNHVPLKDVAGKITPDLVRYKLTLFAAGLRTIFRIPQPRIAVCGINPHCGEHGAIGDEDERVLRPTLQNFRLPDTHIEGPLPADTVFHLALQGRFDGVLAMYHDQGLGPLKTVHFDAVNISVGLPHLRVSPDHGPARDLFLKGVADRSSFEAAIGLAEKYLLGVAS